MTSNLRIFHKVKHGKINNERFTLKIDDLPKWNDDKKGDFLKLNFVTSTSPLFVKLIPLTIVESFVVKSINMDCNIILNCPRDSQHLTITDNLERLYSFVASWFDGPGFRSISIDGKHQSLNKSSFCFFCDIVVFPDVSQSRKCILCHYPSLYFSFTVAFVGHAGAKIYQFILFSDIL